MRVKFEATDATGKVHKRSSTSHVYSHCVVIHFAAHPPSKLWPKGVAAHSHSCLLAERKPIAGARTRMSRPSRSLRRCKCGHREPRNDLEVSTRHFAFAP
jgi:hypothetical protein